MPWAGRADDRRHTHYPPPGADGGGTGFRVLYLSRQV
ncbi:hypothetical protein LINGRAHAP2_LOCUS15869 [Linum grandiflorum]